MKAENESPHRIYTLLGVLFIIGGLGIEGMSKSVWDKLLHGSPFPFTSDLMKLTEHVLVEIGIAFIVAVLVSKLWDRHHRIHVEKRLQDLSQEISLSNASNASLIGERAAQISNACTSIESTVIGYISEQLPMLKTLQQEGVVDVCRRYAPTKEHKQELEPHLLNHITKAIKDSSKFIILGGRAFNDSLGTNHLQPYGRLIVSIQERLKSCPGYTVLILYGSTVHSDSSELLQEYRFRRNDVQDMLNDQRKTLHTITTRLAELVSSGECAEGASVVVRAMTTPPAFWVLATERQMFFDPYLPFRSPGETFVFCVDPPSHQPVPAIDTMMHQVSQHNSKERGNAGHSLPDGHALWDSSGDMATDASLYRRILKSFCSQLALRGQLPSKVFKTHIDRHHGRLTPQELKRWQEIVRACEVLEKKAPAWSR